MLTHTEAEKLLHRYFEGNTTLKEEAELRAYFRAGEVRADLAELDPLFAYWEAAAKMKAPSVKNGAVRRRLPLRWLSAAAVAVLLLFAAGNWFGQQPGLAEIPIAEAEKTTIDWSKYEVTDPEEAYKVLRNALGTASAEMNRSARLTAKEISAARRMLK